MSQEDALPTLLGAPLLLLPSPTNKEKLSIDDILRTWVGEFGRAQILHFTLVSLAWALYALQTLATVFADRSPSWTCTLPLSSACTSSSSICSMDDSLWTWVGSKSQSTVSEWGLLCGDSYKAGLVQSAFFAGALLGSGVLGSLSDTFLGRKGVLAVSCCLTALFGLLTAVSPNYWTYLFLRSATGFSAGGMGLSCFVLATEPIGPSKRGWVGMSSFYFFSFGAMLLAALAYISTSWRYLYVLTSVPALLYCIIVLPCLSESPRWYLVRGRIEDALNVLKSMAKQNGKTVPPEISLDTEQTDAQPEHTAAVPNDADSLSPTVIFAPESQPASGTIFDIFRMPTTRMRMIVMVFVWLDVALVYYGVSLNVGNLGTNLYLSVLLNAIAELPGFAITAMLLGRFGRRSMLICAMLLTGASSICGTVISLEYGDYTSFASEVRLACGVAAICGLAGAYNLTYIYTAELFPTSVRNAAMGLASQAGQVGAIVAPMVVVMGKSDLSIPFAVFSVVSVLGGVIAWMLPETVNTRMYETLAGMLKAEHQSIFAA